MLKKIDKLVQIILDYMEKSPDKIAFVKLAKKLNTQITLQSSPIVYQDICQQRANGNLSPLSLRTIPPEEFGELSSLINIIRETNTTHILKNLNNLLAQQQPLSPQKVLLLLLLSEDALDPFDVSAFNTLCEKLLLHFEVRKTINLTDYTFQNYITALAALSCLFMHQFGLKKDWRFFNSSLKMNDIIYRILAKQHFRKCNQIGSITSLLIYRTFTIQERTFSQVEKQ